MFVIRRVLLLVLILGYLAPLFGCAPQTPTALELVDNTIVAEANVRSYKCNMSVKTSVIQTRAPSPGLSVSSMDCTSAVDLTRHEMQVKLTLDTSVIRIPETEILLDDEWIYLRDRVSSWSKFKLDENMWTIFDQAAVQSQLLKTPLASEKVVQEQVEGVKCYKIEMKPTAEQISSWLSQQWAAIGTVVPEFKLERTKVLDVSVEFWVAERTSLLAKAEIGVGIAQVGDAGSATPETVNAKVNIKVSFSDYNKSVPGIPREARDAPERPSGGLLPVR